MLETLVVGGAFAGLIALLIGARRIIVGLAVLVWIVHDPLDALLWCGIILVGMLAVGFLWNMAAESRAHEPLGAHKSSSLTNGIR